MARRHVLGSPNTAEITLELVGAAYAAAADPTQWAAFGALFQHRLASSIAMYTHPVAQPGRNRTLLSTGLDPAYTRLNAEELHSRNVLILNAARHTAPVLLAEDVVDRETLEGSEFFNEYMRPQGLHHAVNLTLTTGGLHRVCLAALREARFEPYERDRRVLDGLLPHLRRAFEVSERLDLLHVQARAGFSAFDRLSAAVMLVDEEARLVYANRAAECLLATGRCLMARGSRLRATGTEPDARLRAAITGATRPRPTGAALAFPRGNGMPALSAIVLPSEPGRSIFAAHRPLAFVLIHDPAASTVVSEEAVRARFDATPAEARLAIALCAGDSLSAFAASAGVSVTTAKTHLNGLFAKSGINRQADLVRLILSDPALRMLD
jgi:DNA-binding CsgD family transcriptional regulator